MSGTEQNLGLVDDLLTEMVRFARHRDLDRLQTHMLRLIAIDAVNMGGMSVATLQQRLPKVYHLHAGDLVDVMNSVLSRSGVVRPVQEHPSNPPVQETSPQTSQQTSQPEASGPSTPSATFEPTHLGSSAGFVETDREARFEAAEAVKAKLLGGGLLLAWEPPDDGSWIYRVTRSRSRAQFPEYSDATAVTQEPTLVDGVLPEWPVLHYQVWGHTGSDPHRARQSQPRLVAETRIVVPPQEVTIEADQGRVVGTWRELSADQGRVHVFRKPLHGQAGRPTDPQFRINQDSANVAGFVDSGVEGGKDYIYTVGTEFVSDDGVGDMSPFIERIVRVPHQIEAVTDLDVHERRVESGAIVLDIEWTPPSAGRVEIYVSKEQPEVGIHNEDHPAGVLPSLKLGEKLNYPVTDRIGTKVRITDVPWYDGWSRVHFTALTRLEERIFPSPTITKVASQVRITEAKLHQRLHHQVITLTWPAAGSSAGERSYSFENVQVFQFSPGMDVDTAMRGRQLANISSDQYVRDGGLTVRLGAKPCEVALVPISKQEGSDVQGQPLVLHYPGLRRLEYQVNRSVKANPWAKTITVGIKLRAPEPLSNVPTLTLVFNSDHLPIQVDDGDKVPVSVKDDAEAAVAGYLLAAEVTPTWTETTWVAKVPVNGYIRLFADLSLSELSTFAIMDPPVTSLRT